MSSTNEFVTVAFEEEQYCRTKKGLAQWDREKTLRVYGISTDDTVQIHFSLAENYGEAVSVEAAISNGAIEASIPPFIFEKKTSSSQRVYYAYAFIYLLNGESAETVRKIIFEIETRPKPEDYVYYPEDVKTWSKKVNLPLDEAGNPDNGTAGQFAVSDGQGGITWLTVENESETSGDAADVTYDNTNSGLDADNAQEAIDKLSATIDDYVGGSIVEPKTDDIPKVFFEEAIPQTKDDVVTKFRYISKTMDFEGYAEFKAQGNSSMSYAKKNMTVKMYKDAELTEKLKVDFKGWGEQRKHVYKANWIDLTHARNVVSARIWADIVKSRSNYTELPELYRTSPNQGAVDGFPVKVYSQGIYQGRYTLNIPKDAWMANMDDELDNHCILCGEGYLSGCFRQASVAQWTDEVHDSMPSVIRTRWLEIINFVMNSTDEEFKLNLKNYFYVDSLIDYFIYGIVHCGLDAFGKNQLYFTYDGLKWIAGMYDMDATWGLYWNGSKFVSASYTREQFEDFVSTASNGDGNLLYIRLANLFFAEIKARYEELKKGALSIPNIINHFERFTDIAPLDLVNEDYATTTGSGKFTGIPSKTTNNIQQIRQFVLDRYVYCDEYFASLGKTDEVTLSSISVTYGGGNVTVGTELTDLTGITVTATYSDGSTANVTEYTLSGIIAEGSNTITVTYKGLTDTFTVTGVAQSIPCTGISLNVTELSFADNNTKTLTATVTPTDTTDSIVWSSDDETIAKVVNGVVTPIKNGNCKITATCGEYSASCDVTVNIIVYYDITNTLTGCTTSNDSVKVQENTSYSATITAEDGYTIFESIVVKMNGVDITDTVYSDGVISIEYVTGDIEIIATYKQPMAEMILQDDGSYKLSRVVTFDGVDDYVDTGLKLYDENKDFTLFIDFNGDVVQINNNNNNVIHSTHEQAPWAGFNISIYNKTNYVFSLKTRTSLNIASDSDETQRYVILKTSKTNNISVYKLVDGSITKVVDNNDSLNATTFDQTVILGAYQTTTGTKGRFWKGTINDCQVWDGVALSEEEITVLLSGE